MPAALSALRGRLRSSGGQVVRRLGLVPGGEPDGLGEDDRLDEVVLAQRVAVFFPEPPRNAYQLEQWLGPLRALDAAHGVVVITQDSRTAAALRRSSSLSVLCVARTSTMEGLVNRGALGMALYVSHHPRNFQFLRFPGVAHVYVGHGESDKAVSASNQVKAYDKVFVAGQAAVDRLADELLWFDTSRTALVGRPQLPPPLARQPVGTGPATVLYAPTWEGAQPSMSYSSVRSHGVALVESLVAEGLRVVYRPHPRTGANRREVGLADAAVRGVVDTPAARATGSAVDTEVPLELAFAGADALITDVSSVAVEWLPTGRPLIVTVPAEPAAVVAASPLLETVPRLTVDQAAGTGALVLSRLADDVERDGRRRLLDHYLGDTSEGAALTRFLGACADLLAARDSALTASAVSR